MKTTQFRFPITSVFVLLFLCTNSLTADVVWDGASSPSSMKSSADGANLLIDGSFGRIALKKGATKIYANTLDIEVRLNANPIVRGKKHHESRLILRSDPGRKITFYVENDDLTFKGSHDEEQTPLMLFIAPGSNVEFVINSNHNVSFTSDKSFGGTIVYVGFSDENKTHLTFRRSHCDNNPEDNVGINIGQRSLIGFASENQNGKGVIRFDPTNQVSGEGRMILNIASNGGFIVRPSKLSNAVKPRLEDIDTTVLGGGKSKVKIVNQCNTAQSSLLVVNANDRLFDLLIDPFLTLDARNDACDNNGLFSGKQYGFVLGANGILDIKDNAFLDYVGLSNNVCPLSCCITNTADHCCPVECCITNTACPQINCFEGCDPESLTKQRNPSAFFVDGSFDVCSTPAKIHLGQHSAIFFRSGVDCTGFVKNPLPPYQFTVNPNRRTAGAGEIVFDVEGLLHVYGSNGECSLLSKLEILSLEVTAAGGPLFYNGDECIFPRRTCNALDCCFLRAYNKASFLINNRLELFNTVLVHTDQNHTVIRNNDVCSEPTYVGGEIAHLLEHCAARPKIVFYNSRLFVHTDVAFTGLDLVVPTLTASDKTTLRKHKPKPCDWINWDECNTCDATEAVPLPTLNNVSEFRFFYNGNKIDNGVGRQMILGTEVGSRSCNNCSIISADAHLDVIPEGCSDASASQADQLLVLTTAANNDVITCELCNEDVTGQFALQTIFLGNASNISIGEQIDNQANCF